MPPILRSILAVIVGFVVGCAVNMAFVMLNFFLFLPSGIDMWDSAAVSAAFAKAPPTAFLLVLLAHAGGTFVGAWVAAKIARRAPTVHGLIIGAFFLAGGIMNLFQIDHPLWFAIADLILYLPAGWLGGKLAGRGKVGT
jgi:hypothetical protein